MFSGVVQASTREEKETAWVRFLNQVKKRSEMEPPRALDEDDMRAVDLKRFNAQALEALRGDGGCSLQQTALTVLGYLCHNMEYLELTGSRGLAPLLKQVVEIMETTKEKVMCQLCFWLLAVDSVHLFKNDEAMQKLILSINASVCAVCERMLLYSQPVFSTSVLFEFLQIMGHRLEHFPSLMMRPDVFSTWARLCVLILTRPVGEHKLYDVVRDVFGTVPDFGPAVIPETMSRRLARDLQDTSLKIMDSLSALFEHNVHKAAHSWAFLVVCLGRHITSGNLINQLLPLPQACFKHKDVAVRVLAMRVCWPALALVLAHNTWRAKADADTREAEKKLQKVSQVLMSPIVALLTHDDHPAVLTACVHFYGLFLSKFDVRAVCVCAFDCLRVPLSNFMARFCSDTPLEPHLLDRFLETFVVLIRTRYMDLTAPSFSYIPPPAAAADPDGPPPQPAGVLPDAPLVSLAPTLCLCASVVLVGHLYSQRSAAALSALVGVFWDAFLGRLSSMPLDTLLRCFFHIESFFEDAVRCAPTSQPTFTAVHTILLRVLHHIGPLVARARTFPVPPDGQHAPWLASSLDEGLETMLLLAGQPLPHTQALLQDNTLSVQLQASVQRVLAPRSPLRSLWCMWVALLLDTPLNSVTPVSAEVASVVAGFLALLHRMEVWLTTHAEPPERCPSITSLGSNGSPLASRSNEHNQHGDDRDDLWGGEAPTDATAAGDANLILLLLALTYRCACTFAAALNITPLLLYVWTPLASSLACLIRAATPGEALAAAAPTACIVFALAFPMRACAFLDRDTNTPQRAGVPAQWGAAWRDVWSACRERSLHTHLLDPLCSVLMACLSVHGPDCMEGGPEEDVNVTLERSTILGHMISTLADSLTTLAPLTEGVTTDVRELGAADHDHAPPSAPFLMLLLNHGSVLRRGTVHASLCPPCLLFFDTLAGLAGKCGALPTPRQRWFVLHVLCCALLQWVPTSKQEELQVVAVKDKLCSVWCAIMEALEGEVAAVAPVKALPLLAGVLQAGMGTPTHRILTRTLELWVAHFTGIPPGDVPPALAPLLQRHSEFVQLCKPSSPLVHTPHLLSEEMPLLQTSDDEGRHQDSDASSVPKSARKKRKTDLDDAPVALTDLAAVPSLPPPQLIALLHTLASYDVSKLRMEEAIEAVAAAHNLASVFGSGMLQRRRRSPGDGK